MATAAPRGLCRERQGDAMIRRYGEAIVPGKKYRARPGAYAIISDGTQVLLTHQMAPNPEFQLPGGGIDPGEGPIEALHREALEETGHSLFDPKKLGIYRRFVFMPEYGFWAEKVCHVYLARPGLSRGAPREDGHSAHWVNPSDAIDLVEGDGDRAFLMDVFG